LQSPLSLRYRQLLVASSVSNMGDGVFKIALPLLAVQLAPSAAQVAGVTLALTLPDLLIALPGGVLVDRYDRRRTMVGVNAARVFILAGVAVAVLMDVATLPLLYVAAFALGSGEIIFDTATQSIIPQAVAARDLERANSRLYAAEITLNEFVGPPVGGALAGLGISLAFLGSAATYAVAVVALLLMAGTYRPERDRVDDLRTEVFSGMRFLFATPLLLTLALMVAVMVFAFTAWFALLPLYALEVVNISEFEYGLVLTAFAVGGLLGTVLAEPAIKRFGRSKVLLANVIGQAIMFAAPGLTADVWLIGLALTFGSVTSVLWSVASAGIRQRVVPEQIFGRVQSAYRFLSWGSAPIGAALGGLIGELFGLRAAFLTAGALTLLLLLAYRRISSEHVAAALSAGAPR
jgi:MFS family permease